ncbi:transglutaminase-like domain-containing protein [Malacoplasma iowae]|uniref:Transglutaminase domain-containing protein n=1 Tax=Malacoplasma iowae 695 TaxID=1048830 RepID=A0A6P1LI54_MALIO|nr:transglutaminase-like domain-containing protein [Malacoplasma iowae]QHG89795.1 transglutaminase domain-containing protein [Malacoplasma iowae 695]WPL35402.1 transglutaminase domain-containing protein [Malacoplasma iowae]VEU62385.1 Uncharacterised protein [Mycoplasmopsis fermentans]VEU72374.1 Uncharacterised protein [Malacoplasma iowae]
MKKWKKFKVMLFGSTTLAVLLIVPTVLTSCWSGNEIVTNTPDNPIPPTEKPGTNPGEDNNTTPPDEKPVTPPITPDKECYIKYVDYFLDPNTPKGQEENKEYWITNPNTQNKNILTRWGNVPLPMKENVTAEEVYDYFTYVANNGQLGRSYSFGERKIETDWIANIYIQWLVENWALYPWMSFENDPAYFHTDNMDSSQKYDYWILDKWRGNYDKFFDQNKFYIKNNKFSNTADLITIESQQREKFFEMIRLFLINYYRPGMSDLDKALAVFDFVMTYIAYGDSSKDPYGVYMKHMGVCVHYSFTSAFLLNLIGVPAFMNIAGDMLSHPGIEPPGHAVTWVWIDGDNSNQKKWYIMDATASDYKGETTWPSAYILSSNGTWNYFLNPVSDIPGGNIDYNLKQNSFFEFLNGPWYSPYKNQQVKISENYDYLDQMGTFYNIKNSFGKSTYKQSKPVWFNKNWYSMVIENDTQIKFYKTSMGNTVKEEFYVPNNIISELGTLGRTKYSNPFFGTYNDWLAFSVFEKPDYMNQKPLENKRKIYFHNFNDTNWENTQTFDIPDEVLFVDEKGNKYETNKAFFQTFFFDSDKLCIEFSFKDNAGNTIGTTIKRYELPKEVQIKNDKYLDWKVVENAKIYYRLMGNTHQVGTENQQVTLENKEKYNEYFDKFKASDKPYNDLLTLKDYSDKFEKSLLTAKENIASGVSSDIYLIEESAFEQYGYYFDDINPGFDSFYNLNNDQYNTALKYDIYFSSKSDDQYDLIAKDLYKPVIKKTDFEKYNSSPNGKYYIKIHNYNDTLTYNTDPFYFAITDSKNVAIQPEQPKILYTDNLSPSLPQGQTNYYDKFIYNWYDQKYTLSFSYQWSKISATYDVNVSLKRYDFKTKQIKTLKTWYDPLRNEKYDIGKITEDNKGIYFYDVEIKYKSDSKVFNLYSPFMYMMTKNDVDSNNFTKWVSLSNELKTLIKANNSKI